MNAKVIFHGFTLSLETAALVVFVMWNYFNTTTAPERDFARDGDRLCITFAPDQVQYLKAFQNIEYITRTGEIRSLRITAAGEMTVYSPKTMPLT